MVYTSFSHTVYPLVYFGQPKFSAEFADKVGKQLVSGLGGERHLHTGSECCMLLNRKPDELNCTEKKQKTSKKKKQGEKKEANRNLSTTTSATRALGALAVLLRGHKGLARLQIPIEHSMRLLASLQVS